MESKKYRGTVKFFSYKKHFGFIIPDDVELIDVFVHCNSKIKKNQRLKKGDRVSFEIIETNMGPVAMNISIEQ